MMCNETKSLLDPLLDDELPTEQAALVLDHFKTCSGCQTDWDDRLRLKQRMQAFAGSMNAPVGLRQGIDVTVSREAMRNGSFRKYGVKLAMVVAIVAIAIPLGAGLLHKSAADIAATPIDAVVKIADAETILEGNGTKDLDAISQKVGFQVHGLSLGDWRLSSAEIIKMPGKFQPFVQLKYLPKSATVKDTLICYQTKPGQIDIAGLNEHHIEGRSICCGTVRNLSVVFWQSDKLDHLIVSSVPQAELMKLALKT